LELPHIPSRRTFLRLGGSALAALILSACGPAPAPPEATIPQPTAPPPTAAPATATAAALPADRPFVATDPGAVQLAAGRPQLVEFFAFW
jgi:hypothetical protein